MPTQPKPIPAKPEASPQTQTTQQPSSNGTKRRPGPPKPGTFKDFASI